MENREVMLVSVFLVLVSALAFNLNDFSITGYAIKDNSASLRLDPIVAKANSDITITIAPASEGTSRFVEFYQNNEKIGETVRLCNQLRCMEKVTVVYSIPELWNGKFEAQIYDYTSEDYIIREFVVN
ncbi:MAG TPA: hypothetical protein VJB94_00035 [Candidatus Nanoarchaeia archaeon]|nr:hypothetical protein [Candidatus Nanoarchaeia archaeon]